MNRLLARVARLCAGSVAVRALGFGMRMWLARNVDGQALGIYEMSAQLSMLLLAPLVSGLPQAASRLSAQRLSQHDVQGALRMGRAALMCAGAGAAALSIVCLPLLPSIARVMGDARMAAPFAMMLPSSVPLALCAVYYGCMYARGSTLPASLQLIEQSARLLCALLLMSALGGSGAVADASLLAMAQTVGAVLALACARRVHERSESMHRPTRTDMVLLWHAAWPVSLGRMGAAGLRSVCQLMLPGRLALAGLSAEAAMREYGIMSGMALPMVFLPFMFTGPLATLTLPRMAAARSDSESRHIALRTIAAALLAGGVSWALLAGLGPMLGAFMFGNARAGDMIRMLAPLAPLGCVSHALNALIQGMGRERAALRATLTGAAASAALTWLLAARPELGVMGLGLAMMLGHALTLMIQCGILWRGMRRRR